MHGRLKRQDHRGPRKKRTGLLRTSRVPRPTGVDKIEGGAAPTTLKTIYARLHKAFGPQKWWPAETPFEVIVGAILTQSTNWGNVERALLRLKKSKKLNPAALKSISQT